MAARKIHKPHRSKNQWVKPQQSCPPLGAPRYPNTYLQPKKSYRIGFLALSTSGVVKCVWLRGLTVEFAGWWPP